ncbi:MAG TPA: hypothetical protein PKL83_01225 [bacterium]|nr:hypothetical protein [bacterium]
MPAEPQSFKKNCGSVAGGCLGIIGFGLLIGFFMNREQKAWAGFFYPDATQTETTTIIEKNLKSLEKCREWAESEAEERGLQEGAWDYECGTGCKVSDTTTSQDRAQGYVQYGCAEYTR